MNSGKGLDSPLHAAARNCSAELVTLLIDFGADIWVKNAESKRPMELVPPGSPMGQLFLQKEGTSYCLFDLFTWDSFRKNHTNCCKRPCYSMSQAPQN